MAYVRNIAVIMKKLDGEGGARLEGPPNQAYHILVSLLFCKALDLWGTPRGDTIDAAFMRFWSGDAQPSDDRAHRAHRDNFKSKLSVSPLIVIDETIQSTRIIGMHLRGSWQGLHSGFDPRQQVIVVNKFWMNVVQHAEQAVLMESSMQNIQKLCVARFRIVAMFLHELGHLKVTYLGHGEQGTPPHIRGLNPRQRETNQGEAGEFFERGFFGGLVDFHFDDESLGERGFPWVYKGKGEAYRADVDSIVRLMTTADPPQDNVPFITTTTTSSNATERPDERPTLTGNGIGQSAGAIMSLRDRSEEPLTFPRTPRVPGVEMSTDQLRQLAARLSTVSA